MKAELFFIPIATLGLVTPACATVYMSVAQAQAALFPGASFTQDFRTLTPEQMQAIEKQSGVNVRNASLQVWRVSTGGWFIADDVVGKHEFIPFALAIDAKGAVSGLEILEYREAYGGEVRGAQWRAQFTGKNAGAGVELGHGIENISGATLSSKHITDGVRRLLVTHDLILTTP
jgi:Na+-translocating ferredoxin:NAD+ oxidoreductase RnfG subunit